MASRSYHHHFNPLLLLVAVVGLLLSACDVLDKHESDANTGIEPNYPCKNGLAANRYECSNIDLVAHIAPQTLGGETLNDIWGWTDPKSNRRYALVGVNTGVTIVDITNPSSPLIMGRVPSHATDSGHTHSTSRIQTTANRAPNRVRHASTWGDMKIYKNYMYSVSEEDGHGVHVFDLTRLRNTRATAGDTFSVDFSYDKLSTAHNISINTETGYAYAVGTGGKTCENGGLHMINLDNPSQPEFAGCYGGTGYIHDTQCVTYRGPDSDYKGSELCFNSNAGNFTIVDVTDKNNPTAVSTLTYDGLGYVHQGWLTEDHRYFLLGDEFDELQNNHNLRTYVLDVSDLDDPEMKFYHEADVPSVDHNLFVNGQYVYQSNYTSGVFILNLSNIEGNSLVKEAHFDTYPSNNNPVFNGTWSNYPFFSNGILIASDISNGLFILKPDL